MPKQKFSPKFSIILVLLLTFAFSTKALASLTFTTNAITGDSASPLTLTTSGGNNPINLISTGTAPIVIRNGTALPAPTSGFAFQLGTYGLVEGIGDAGYLAFRRTNTSAASPSAVLNNNSLGYIPFQGYRATAYSGDAAYIAAKAAQNWSDSATGSYLALATTANNSTSVATRAILHDWGQLELGLVNASTPAWGSSGVLLRVSGLTWTDTTSSGTVAIASNAGINVPTFAASSATTFTNAANVYIAGDVVPGTNVTLTNSYGLWNVGKTRLDGSVSIGTPTPNANAVLDVSSTTKAFMPPRMTTAQRDAIPSPTAGMVIYNSTTNKLNVFTTTWEAVTSS